MAPEKPPVTPALAQAVTRLGYLRRQLRELEAEEMILREEILNAFADWPKEAFPLRIGPFEVRIQERVGRIDRERALHVLRERNLGDEIPFQPVVQEVEGVVDLVEAIDHEPMPEMSRVRLQRAYQKAIGWEPAITAEWVTELWQSAKCDVDTYRACFKDGRPVTSILQVR